MELASGLRDKEKNTESEEERKEIKAEDLITKLKDDGDFDTLRIKIIRKLKENESLRSSIISAVKQSAALNRPGAESLKPRQLSDAIHEDIGTKVMSQISDVVWEIIQSSDGMKNEIKETVQSVYRKLVNPKGEEVGEKDIFPNEKEADASQIVTSNGNTNSDKKLSGPPGSSPCDHLQTNASQDELQDPSGFSPSDHQQANDGQEEHKKSPSQERQPLEKPGEVPQHETTDLQPIDSGPPGSASVTLDAPEKNDGSDEDPDVPPGFG